MTDRGSLIPRRLLAAELRNLRADSGHTLEDVSRELLISTSKISRLENAQGLPQLRDVRDLVRFFGIENTDKAARLEGWVDASRRAPWWRRFGAPVPPVNAEYLAFESAAAEIHAYTAHYVPSLLQTRAYAEALIRAIIVPDESDVDALVELRIARQSILTRVLEPVRIDVVVDGSALLRSTGSAEVMRDQLTFLADEAESKPHITLRVLELSSGPSWASYHGTFSVFRFPPGTHPDVANPEDVGKYLDEPRTVEDFLDQFDALRDLAADPEQSIVILRRLAAEYSDHPKNG